MNTAIILGALFILGILFFIFGGLYLVWRLGKYGKLLSSVLFLSLLYLIYTAIYPEDDFFITDFERTASFSLPKSANVTYKRATFPDLHGDYISEAVIKMSEKDHKLLIYDKEFKHRSMCNKPRDIEKKLNSNLKIVGCQTIRKRGVYFYWNIYSDKKTIYYLLSHM